MSGADMEQVIAHTKFDFRKVDAGKTIVSEGDACRQWLFLLSGESCMVSRPAGNKYAVSEEIAAPLLLQPERLFGLTQHYTATVTAQTTCHLLALDKQEVIRLSGEQFIFRLNMLNILSTAAQRWAARPWRSTAVTLRQRLVRFFEQHCQRPAGPKVYHILRTDLASEVADIRLNTSRELVKMQQEGLLTLSRGKIIIPQIEKLIAAQ